MRVAILVFEGVDLLDVTLPLEVLALRASASAPPIEPVLVSATRATRVVAEPRFVFHADRWIGADDDGDADPFDAVVVPGGVGLDAILPDRAVWRWLATQAARPRTRFMTSVCAGALLLGVARLLAGHRATTHWASLPVLAVIPGVTLAEDHPRVVVSGDRMTSGGVTSGAELGLRLKQALVGEQPARNTELILQYDPEPPYGVGNPTLADPETLAQSRALLAPLIARRMELVRGLVQ